MNWSVYKTRGLSYREQINSYFVSHEGAALVSSGEIASVTSYEAAKAVSRLQQGDLVMVFSPGATEAILMKDGQAVTELSRT